VGSFVISAVEIEGGATPLPRPRPLPLPLARGATFFSFFSFCFCLRFTALSLLYFPS